MNPLRRLIDRWRKVAAGARPRRWPEAEDVPRRGRRRRGRGRGARLGGLGGDDGYYDDGGAAVREPRRPRPGPRSDSGAAPIPAPPQQVHLGDARE